jgi:hypothetical protein
MCADEIKVSGIYSVSFAGKRFTVQIHRRNAARKDWWCCTDLETGCYIMLPTTAIIREEVALEHQ